MRFGFRSFGYGKGLYMPKVDAYDYTEDFETYENLDSLIGAGETAWTWTSHAGETGDFQAVTGMYGQIHSDGGQWVGAYYNGGAAWSNYSVEVDKVVSGRCRVVGRWTSSGGYVADCIPGSELRLIRLLSFNPVDPAVTVQNLDGSVPASLTSLGLKMNGSSLQMIVNGVEMTAVTDTNLTAGTIGVICAVGFNPYSIDNIRVKFL